MVEELFDVVNEADKVVGKTTRTQAHFRGLMHRSVFFFILDKQGRIFVNQRSMSKQFYPGYWSILFGGHVASGDSYDETVVREAKEEAGIEGNPIYLGDYKKRFDEKDKENGKVYAFITEKEPVLDKNEVIHGSFMTLQEVEEKLQKETFIPETKELLKMLIDFKVAHEKPTA